LNSIPQVPFFGDKRPALGELGTDYIFICPTRNITTYASTYNGNATNRAYFYRFNHPLSFDGWGPNFTFCTGHVCHGAELPFVFNSAELAGFQITNEERQLGELMVAYWTNFARTGDPNYPLKVPLVWPAFGSSSDQYLELRTPQSTIITGLRKEQCDFWDKLGYHFGW